MSIYEFERVQYVTHNIICQGLTQASRFVGPFTGPEKAKFLEKGPKIMKNLPISKKRALAKKNYNKPIILYASDF